MKKKEHAAFLTMVVCIVMIFLPSCHFLNLERKLSPQYKEFFVQVRYIISTQEYRTFLNLPDEKKDAFIQEFWKRRDPDPLTDVNEFQMEYFDRMEAADELFLSEGKPGWMTDRGRIFILYGAPLDRLSDPAGTSIYSRCVETWYYGNFPVYFVDNTCTGVYKLMTIDFTLLQPRHIMNMVGANQTVANTGETRFEQNKRLRFDWRIQNTRISDDQAEGEVYLKIPYASLWFSEKDGRLESEMVIHLELKDSSGRIAWEHDQTESIQINEADLIEENRGSYEFVIPFLITDEPSRLREGKNRMTVSVSAQTGDTIQKKSLQFRFTPFSR